MYMIFKEVLSVSKDGSYISKFHPISRKKFTSYEKARQHARKWLRIRLDKYWRPSSNPCLMEASLRIRKV